MPAFADSVLQNVTTSTGDITLGSPVAGYVGVASRYSANAEDIFLLEQVDVNLNPNGEWILFRGTYIQSTGVVQRTALIRGSVALNFDFSSGTKLLSIVPDPRIAQLPVYNYADLPTPASGQYGRVYCPDFLTSGLGGEVTWNGSAWKLANPILLPKSATYTSGASFAITLDYTPRAGATLEVLWTPSTANSAPIRLAASMFGVSGKTVTITSVPSWVSSGDSYEVFYEAEDR